MSFLVHHVLLLSICSLSLLYLWLYLTIQCDKYIFKCRHQRQIRLLRWLVTHATNIQPETIALPPFTLLSKPQYDNAFSARRFPFWKRTQMDSDSDGGGGERNHLHQLPLFVLNFISLALETIVSMKVRVCVSPKRKMV